MKQQLRKLKLWELGIAEWPYDASYEKMKEIVHQNLDGCHIKTTYHVSSLISGGTTSQLKVMETNFFYLKINVKKISMM